MFLRNYPCLQTQTWNLNNINLVFQVCADQNLFLSCGKRHPNPLIRHFTCLFFFFSFRLNSPNVQITILKWTIQWHLVYSQHCSTVSGIWFQTIFIITPRGSPSSTKQSLPTASSSTLGKHEFIFCLYRVTCSGQFIYTESHNMWPLGSGFFHLILFVRIIHIVDYSVLKGTKGIWDNVHFAKNYEHQWECSQLWLKMRW